jgi:periplasmic divalent cation tolerance protein
VKITVFYIPVGSEEEAHSLSKLALEQKLTICTNIFPIQSLYPWEGKHVHDHEFIIILKTFPNLIDEVNAFLEQHHSYKTPCILHWDAEVNESYGAWMLSSLTRL